MPTDSEDVDHEDEPGAVEVPGAVQVIKGVENVESGLFALGSVWAPISNRPDRFSRQPLEAGVVRINPATRAVEKVLDSPGAEPTMTELDGHLWVKLVDRIVALDAAGAEVASLPFATDELGDLIAGEGHLWLLNFNAATVTVIDPSTATVVRTIETGAFPASPTSAFGHIWVPSSLDGTVTIIDEKTLGDTTLRTASLGPQQLEDATPVEGAMTGAEVWVTTRDGAVFAITAHGDALGQVRQVRIDRAINRVHILDGQAFLLPIAGRDVFVLNLATEAPPTRIPTESIPFRALVANDLLWVTGDGIAEILSVIEPQTLTVQAQFQIGSNESNTNGPHRPFVVAEEIWIPNRDDSTFIIIDTNNI